MSGEDVSLDLLRTFQVIHRNGTLTAAARILGLSQPSVTAQLRALETALGRPLFRRHARGVCPTAAGDELAAQLDGPLDTLVGIAAGLGGSSAPAPRTLWLGGPAELVQLRILPALAGAVADGLRVRIRPGLADDLLAELAQGQLDLVVSTVRPRRRGLTAEPLFDEEFVLVASASLAADRLRWPVGPARAARPTTPGHAPTPPTGSSGLTGAVVKALAGVPLLAYAEDLPIIRRWWRYVLGCPPPQRAALVVPDLRALRAAAVAGAGVTVLPRYLCADDLTAGRLVELLGTEDPPINTLYLSTRTATRQEPHVATARAILLAEARSW